jgi:hypothetical protein
MLKTQLEIVNYLPERLPGNEVGLTTPSKITYIGSVDDPWHLQTLGGYLRSWKAPKSLEEVEKEVIGRTLSFHSMDPAFDKRAPTSSRSMSRIAREVRFLIHEACNQWGSVKPMTAKKAVLAVRVVETRLVDPSQIDELLFYTGTPDYKPVVSRQVTTIQAEPAPQDENFGGLPREIAVALSKGHWIYSESKEEQSPLTMHRIGLSNRSPDVTRQQVPGTLEVKSILLPLGTSPAAHFGVKLHLPHQPASRLKFPKSWFCQPPRSVEGM